jgi:4-amino-4-deoxy-L-arabinose transferase-like glycosyltransferase
MQPDAATRTAPSRAAGRGGRAPRFDRWFWLAILVAALVVIPRSVLISRAHSETLDEQAHLRRGFAAAPRNPGNISIQMNDPPFGDVLLTLPPLALGASSEKPLVWQHWPGGKPADADAVPPQVAYRSRVARQASLYGHVISPEHILLSVAIWKAILFLPFAGLVFHFTRRIYDARAAWLALAMILIDPTFAAHTPIAALDVLGVESILLACYLGWRYFESPTRPRLLATAVATALALSIKHTAIAVPPILAAYAVAFWLR